MAKDLTGTNILAQKEADYCNSVFLLEIDRDHPEIGLSVFRVCTATKEYEIDGNTYFDRLSRNGLGNLRMSIPSGGGIATINTWKFDLLNPDGLGNDRLSEMLRDYFLENDEVRLLHVFRTGSETAADILTIFVGQIQDPIVRTLTFTLTAKDGTRSTLTTIPRDVVDLIEFPNLPLNNRDIPIPLVFGDLNVGPFNASGSRPRLAPCVCVDFQLNQYTSGRFNSAYGQPYVYYRSSQIYGRIEDYTQSGAFFTIDSGLRYTRIKPVRPLGTNDVPDWRLAVDGNTATGAAIESGDNLDLQMRGVLKLGTVDTVSIEIVATGGYDYTIAKTGETDITGSDSGDASISLAGWDFSANWDFEQIHIQIDGTGSATIKLVTLDLLFLEQESGDQQAFPLFQAVEGYTDVATRYADGGVINSADLKLTLPMDTILVMARDKRTGMRMPAAQIHTANLTAERAKLSGWRFDGSIIGEVDYNQLSSLCKHGKLRMFRSYDAAWKFSVFDKSDPPAHAFFHETNLAVSNPEQPADKQLTSLIYDQTPIDQIKNEFILNYGWDHALGRFTEQLIASPHYLVSGTCTILAGGILEDLSADFIAEGVLAGHKAFVVREQLHVVDEVLSGTQLSISPVAGGEATVGHEDEYYIGPNFDFRCFRSVLQYKLTDRETINAKLIQDDATAAALLDHMVDLLTERRGVCRFRTWLNAVDVEMGDFALLDHPDVTSSKRPILMGALSAGIDDEDTTISLADDAQLLINEDDILVLKSANNNQPKREVVVVTAVDDVGGTIDVLRGQAGTIPKSWSEDDEIWRAITNWEVTDIELVPAGNSKTPVPMPEFELTLQETPRHYTPVAHYAPEGAPNWADATPEQRVRYAYYTYPNGEVEWLNPDSALTTYAPEPV